MTTTFPYVENSIMPDWIILFFEIAALLILIFFLVLSFFEKLLASYLKKSKQNKILLYILLLSFVIYILILNSNFGYIINWILSFLNSSLNLNQKSSIETLLVLPTFKAYMGIFTIILLVYVLYRLLLQPVISIFNKMSTTFIVATITLTNGTKLHNKYILRPSVDGNLLIGDKPRPTEDCDKIMLPRTSILIIEFKRVYRSINNKETSIKRILLPPDFK